MKLKDITINDNLIDYDGENDKIRKRCKYLLFQMNKCETDKEYWDFWAEYHSITLIPNNYDIISDSIDF